MVVNVMNDRCVYVRNAGVIEVSIATPVSAIESVTGVTKSVVNAPVKANDGTPIPGMPGIETVSKTPIAGRP
jgi:hypothetical protein